MKQNFTHGRIEAFTCPPQKHQVFLWDSGVPGLGIRATAGSKTYIFQARLNGRTIRHRIGAVSDWDIDEARAEGRRLARLIDLGIDPKVEKREREQANQEAKAKFETAFITLKDVWEEYIEARCSEWSSSHLRDHYAAMQKPGVPYKRIKGTTRPGPLYYLLNKELSSLSAEDLQKWLEKEKSKRPAVAARAYRLLRTCLSWASDHPKYGSLIDISSLLNGTIKRTVPRMKSRAGDVLQKEQLPAWFDAVKKIQNKILSAYLQSLLITGARRNELTKLVWDDVDFQWRTIAIKDKVEGERIIPLTPYLAHLLASLPKRNEFIFSSPTSRLGHIAEPRKAHNRALQAAGLPHMSLHGLRRSFGTLSEWVECPVGIVAQIQGHKPSAIAEKHYRRRPVDLLRVWHTKIEAFILKQADIEQPAEEEPIKTVKIIA